MSTKNKIFKIYRTKAEFEEDVNIVYHLGFNKGLDMGTAYGIDMAILAFGRTHPEFGKEFYEELFENIKTASQDFGELADADILDNHDKQLWYSTQKLDDEINSYLKGAYYPPFDERYKK